MKKRLFIFASYDKDNIVDDCDLLYLRALSELGDIVFYADNDLGEIELDSVREIPNVLYAGASRHGEYDFGSYKRGFAWARDNGILKNYERIYLTNNSVYGPLRPIAPILEGLEAGCADAVGMYHVVNHNITEHLQAWFVGLNPKIFLSEWFAKFIGGVKKQHDKVQVIISYELGLSRLIIENGGKIEGFITCLPFDDMFQKPLKALDSGLPFIKKSQLAIQNIRRRRDLHKRIASEQLRIFISLNMMRNHVYFGACRNAWKFKLFGRITLLTLKVYRYYGMSNPEYKLVLLRFITLYKLVK